jgi:hypothetical protein
MCPFHGQVRQRHSAEALGSIRGGKNAKKRAVVAVARKLLIIMRRLCRMQESFVPFPGIEMEQQAAA